MKVEQKPGQQAVQLDAHSVWENIGESLRAALDDCSVSRGTVGTAVILAAALLTGCTPQMNSYWSKTMTKLPPPPPEARMQLGVSTEDDGKVFINYVMWNADRGKFERKDIHYTTTFLEPGTFGQAGGYQQEIADGEVLYGGATVLQAEGRIVLPNGNYIEGKTGHIYSPSGTLVKKLTPVGHAAAATAEAQ